MQNPDFLRHLHEQYQSHFTYFPSKRKSEKFIDDMFHFLFPSREDAHISFPQLEARQKQLAADLWDLLAQLSPDEELNAQIVDQFFHHLPHIYAKLLKDADAILQFDPAANSIEEVIVAYPGFYAIAVYRIAHHLLQQQVKWLPRIFSEHAHRKTGIDIHPGAQIGESFFIDHGTGVVIGETTIIGNEVKIYQGVTLGALSVSKDKANTKRHPTIEDHVIIYSGTTILGGNTVVGHHSVIGGNVWLTESVAPYSFVHNTTQVEHRVKKNLPDDEVKK
ncbi:serine acetyltransferase [Sphingobacteriales bacterium UPWRP_1]|nr:serine acetyltransferase [Sphingobacteriales bacterium TSM_CSS]PSJ73715.1 serine acetyltransferase [Sphingobacteriales bacterium UPWRP_1]